MKIIYMLSGFDKELGFYKNQKEYLKKDIRNNSNITFIASDFKNHLKTDKHSDCIIKAFKEISILFNKINIIDYRTTKKESLKYLQESDIIFIMGGDTYSEFKYIKEYNLIDEIKNFEGIIIGVSAGSLNMSTNVCYLDEYKDYRLVKYKGIGLTDINIYPHFDIKNDDFLKETLAVSKYTKLYALPNESFIRIKDNDIEFIGEYYICENNNYRKVNYENN